MRGSWKLTSWPPSFSPGELKLISSAPLIASQNYSGRVSPQTLFSWMEVRVECGGWCVWRKEGNRLSREPEIRRTKGGSSSCKHKLPRILAISLSCDSLLVLRNLVLLLQLLLGGLRPPPPEDHGGAMTMRTRRRKKRKMRPSHSLAKLFKFI